jgi:hypothetical protein
LDTSFNIILLPKKDLLPYGRILMEPLRVNGEMGRANQKANGGEIVLGRNLHNMCLPITEPDANDECTGDKEAYMASVLARYRKTLIERTKHHLGDQNNLKLQPLLVPKPKNLKKTTYSII